MPIGNNPTRPLPEEWTNTAINELFEHARDLGHHGNPAGFLLTVAWGAWIAERDEYGTALKAYREWDYASIRQWIAAHPERVANVWRLTAIRL